MDQVFNDNASTAGILGYALHNGKVKDDKVAKLFNILMPIAAGEYKVLFRNINFDFGIG